MLLRRTAVALSRRAVITPVVQRSFTSSVIRRKPLAISRALGSVTPQLILQPGEEKSSQDADTPPQKPSKRMIPLEGMLFLPASCPTISNEES